MNCKKLGLALFFIVNCAVLFAAGTEKLTVAYYNSKNFQEGKDDSSIKNGYSYEYLQKISSETGWSYEYVYGDLYSLWLDFQNGKIDLMAGLGNYGQNSSMLFPDYIMGSESYYIFKKNSDSSISSEDPSTLEGKKIGSVKDNIMTDALYSWLSQKNLNVNVVLYDFQKDVAKAFTDGAIDCFVDVLSSADLSQHILPVLKVFDNNYYLAVSKNRPDVLAQLNKALEDINNREPYFIQNLTRKYYKNTILSSYLSESELNWLRNHPTLRIGLVKEYLPFCDEVDGKPVGLITDVLSDILTSLKLGDKVKIEYFWDESYWDLYNQLQNGKIDVMFPCFKSLWHSEQLHSRETNAVCPANVDIIFKGEYSEDKQTQIAISDHSPIQKIYADLYFPTSQIVHCKNAPETLTTVANGGAKSTLFSSYRSPFYLGQKKYKKLNSLQLTKDSGYAFSLAEGNPELLSILNKGIDLLDQDKISYLIYNYTNEQSVYNVWDFIHLHKWLFAIPSLLIILILLGFLNWNLAIRIHAAKEMKSLKIQAETDGLTGILNRGCGEAITKQNLSKGINGLLCILDVDKFKTINDTFGHQIGDKVLIAVADCLKAAFRDNDIIFRLGGDEFAVVAKDITTKSTGKKVVHRFLKQIDAIEIPEMENHKVTVSVGARIFTEDEKDFSILYKQADSCVYVSKKKNGNAVTFFKA